MHFTKSQVALQAALQVQPGVRQGSFFGPEELFWPEGSWSVHDSPFGREDYLQAFKGIVGRAAAWKRRSKRCPTGGKPMFEDVWQ